MLKIETLAFLSDISFSYNLMLFSKCWYQIGMITLQIATNIVTRCYKLQ